MTAEDSVNASNYADVLEEKDESQRLFVAIGRAMRPDSRRAMGIPAESIAANVESRLAAGRVVVRGGSGHGGTIGCGATIAQSAFAHPAVPSAGSHLEFTD